MQGARRIKHLLDLEGIAGYILIKRAFKSIYGVSDFSEFEMGLKICHAIFRPNSGSVWGCMSLADMARFQISGGADHTPELQKLSLRTAY